MSRALEQTRVKRTRAPVAGGGEGDGAGAGARHAPLLPMKFGCSSTLMLAAVLVTVHHITSSPSSNACDSCSSPFFTPRYSALLLGGIFSSAVMSSFRYLRHASHLHWVL